MHEFNPNLHGSCKTYVGGARNLHICGMSAEYVAHVRWIVNESVKVVKPFEEFEVRESESFDAFHIHFHGERATEEMRQFVEDAIREKLESL